MSETIITVAVTRLDEYGNLWVTPAGGGDEVKIAEKRSNLHPLFEQGKAVMLHYETYKNRPYVAGAKPVAGELPQEGKATILPEHQEVIAEARKEGAEMLKGKPTGDGKYKADPDKMRSIERQVSLKSAVDWCICKVNLGEKIKTADVLIVAKVFESYLDTGLTVTKKEN